MKKILLALGLVVLFCSPVFATERITVTKDSAGTMSHVTRYVTESGITMWESGASGLSIYATTYNNIPTSALTGVTGSGTAGQIAIFSGTTTLSSAATLSGNSVAGGTLVIDVQSSEVRGGVSTYGIHGNVSLAQDHLNGRVGEIKASASPVIKLPNLSSAVTGMVIMTDITTAGNDSGATIWCSGNTIYSGVGASATSGKTIFVISGNTGFTLTLKETSIGWKVWGTDAVIKRP
jgi:hypothetical protein